MSNGNAAKIDLAATLEGEDITVTRAQIDGRTVRISAQGSRRLDTLDVDWKIALSDLAVLAPEIAGRIEAQGRVHGAPDDLNLDLGPLGRLV